MKTGFIGAGKMAQAIIAAKKPDEETVFADADPETAGRVAEKFGLKALKSAAEVAKTADLIFLAVRPQDVAAVAAEIKPLLRKRHTIVSIVAGKTIARLEEAFGEKPTFVRVMPNLALRANAGMCVLCKSPGCPEKTLKEVESIFRGAGETMRLDENAFDAVTALSGSGPAYFAYMAEAMAEGGVALGLKPDDARMLALQTMYGTAKFLCESKFDLGKFIEGVCTKGGTTAAGMKKLNRPAFKKTVAATLAAAAARSKELA